MITSTVIIKSSLWAVALYIEIPIPESFDSLQKLLIYARKISIFGVSHAKKYVNVFDTSMQYLTFGIH
jgi:hypothetical protein